MKTLLTACFLLLATGLFARQPAPTTVRTRIIDDGQTLLIDIDGRREGEKIHLHKALDVTGWNRLQKEAVKLRAFLAVRLVPPFHEIAGLVLTALGALLLVVALGVAGVRTGNDLFRKPAPGAL